MLGRRPLARICMVETSALTQVETRSGLRSVPAGVHQQRLEAAVPRRSHGEIARDGADALARATAGYADNPACLDRTVLILKLPHQRFVTLAHSTFAAGLAGTVDEGNQWC